MNYLLSLRSLRSLRLKSFVGSCQFVKFVSRLVLALPVSDFGFRFISARPFRDQKRLLSQVRVALEGEVFFVLEGNCFERVTSIPAAADL